MPVDGSGRYNMNPAYARQFEGQKGGEEAAEGDQPQAKISQEDAGYKDSESCGDCVHFSGGEDGASGSCDLVSGDIDSTYWCKLYESSGGAEEEQPPNEAPGEAAEAGELAGA
jgi:hypothetical protein